jgi:hypothetical protein
LSTCACFFYPFFPPEYEFSFYYSVGWGWSFAFMQYGTEWKQQRRVFHNQFDATIAEHRTIQRPAAAELLGLLLRTPERFLDHLEQ